MGSGMHGGFGNTRGAKSSIIFKPVRFEGTVTVDGKVRDVSRRVYQRHDIDFEQIDRKGNSNLKRMRNDQAPNGSDGRPVQLHHVIQKENGPLVEIREVTHQEYARVLHGLGGPGMSFRNDPVLNKQYNNFRSAYWKWRAQSYKGGKAL